MIDGSVRPGFDPNWNGTMGVVLALIWFGSIQSGPDLSWNGLKLDYSLLKWNKTIFFCPFQSL